MPLSTGSSDGAVKPQRKRKRDNSPHSLETLAFSQELMTAFTKFLAACSHQTSDYDGRTPSQLEVVIAIWLATGQITFLIRNVHRVEPQAATSILLLTSSPSSVSISQHCFQSSPTCSRSPVLSHVFQPAQSSHHTWTGKICLLPHLVPTFQHAGHRFTSLLACPNQHTQQVYAHQETQIGRARLLGQLGHMFQSIILARIWTVILTLSVPSRFSAKKKKKKKKL